MELLDAPFEASFDVLNEIDGVVVVRWPQDAARAIELEQIGTPRLLLVAPEAEAPDVSAELCAWIRLPAHERDVQARTKAWLPRHSAGVTHDRRNCAR